MPGIQPPPPPVRQDSLPHVFMASSVPATVRNSHFFFPVVASRAKIGPRPGHSPPCAPMITVPFAYSGAPVKPTVSFCESISRVSQTTFPDFISRPSALPSMVPTKTLPSPSATPRL
ncbi:hypothetical protein ACVWW2_007596 [Bradyrhizobium sp. LM4.3]